MQPAVGHYGVFNGSRFRAEIVPRIVDFITSFGGRPGRSSRGWCAAKAEARVVQVERSCGARNRFAQRPRSRKNA